MKNLRFIILLFFLLALVIAIDLPENVPLKINYGPIKVTTHINPLSIHFSLGKIAINKDFKTHLGLDLKGGSHLVFEADMADIKKADRNDALESARDIIDRRVNFFGVSEPSVQTLKSENNYRIIVDLPGNEDISQAIALIGQTARLEFTEELPPDTKFATGTPDFMKVTKKTGLTGKHIKRSTIQYDDTGKPAVGLEFNTEGTKLFAALTQRSVGHKIGIFIDGYPITSPPVVETPILDGQGIITGQFTIDEAKKLSVAINSGALPVSINLIEQRNIGPTLGAEHIRKSMIAGIIGLLGVVAFMVLYYGRLGIIAVCALIIYGLINFALFRTIPVTLTLPGIAGFILSIGMAVDSNILIFERIKEERRKGNDLKSAINVGFGRAIHAIKDANFTTLLVAFVLFNPLNWSFFPQFGLIRGFALTLGIGVLTSLFTGVFITRRLIDMFYRGK